MKLDRDFTTPSGAIFNHDRSRRTLLWRRWNKILPPLNMIMLNPSDAGEDKNDPTVTRQIERGRRLRCGLLIVTNAYDVMATDPDVMMSHPEPNTEENDRVIRSTAEETIDEGGIVIAAWGPHTAHLDRHRSLLHLLSGIPLHAVVLTKENYPGHPLYIKYDVVPFPYPPPPDLTQDEGVW